MRPYGGDMALDQEVHHRKSIRLKNYDYAQAGLYFITLCTHNRLLLFGNIIDGKMQLNDAGKLAQEEWRKTVLIRPNTVLHEFVVMPNHFHCIIEFVGAHCMRPDCDEQTGQIPQGHVRPGRGQQGRVQRAPTVGDVVRGYKAAVTKGIRSLTNLPGSPIWQRNYYEHIIRNEAAYLKIVDYIQTNPQRWLEDAYHA